MAKKKSDSGYEWIKATVCDGEVTFRYHLVGAGNAPVGSLRHDENVSGWSDSDIRNLGCDLLDVPCECANEIEIIWN